MNVIIDSKTVQFTEGQTILDAARCAGVDIPTLCFREQNDCRIAPASCLVCLVKVNGKFVPSCATKVEDGMIVESETGQVRQLRKTALELLLSEHYGDCFAPCRLACPAGLDIPEILRAVQRNNLTVAAQLVQQVDCKNCKKPCETVCRRKGLDNGVAISRIISEIAAKVNNANSAKTQAVKIHWSCKRNKPSKETLQAMERFAVQLKETERITAADNELTKEANRCLHCDCLGREKCLLLHYAALYKAELKRFDSTAPREPATLLPIVGSTITFEPDKCIRCGVCIAVAEKNGEETGLAFTGRGYSVKIGVPFGRSLEAALQHSAAEAAELCPAGALNVFL